MRINEDYLDDIEQEEIVPTAVSGQDMRDDDSWPYIFHLESGSIVKKRKPDFYIQKAERLYHLLATAFDKCPAITDFNHNFVIQIGYFRDNKYNEMVTEHGALIRWSNFCDTIEEYFNPAEGRRTDFIIHLGLKAKTDTMMQIRRLMLSLWKIFSTAFRMTYRSAGQPKSVWMCNGKFTVSCSDSTEWIWESKNEREHKFFTEAYRAFHPEMKPAQIKPLIDEFTGQDSGLQKALKKFRTDEEWNKKYRRSVPYMLKYLIDGSRKVELMEDGRLNFHWGRNEYRVDDYLLTSSKTLNKEYIISDVTEMEFGVSVGIEGAKPGYIKDKCERIMQFCKDIAPEAKTVVLEVNGPSLKEFINSSVDFRKLLPGMNVKVEVTSEEINIYSWEMENKRFYINQYPANFDVKITDSYDTKTYHFQKIYK